MSEYTAYIDDVGDLVVQNRDGALDEFLNFRMVPSVEEFFRRKRDEELGRWRDPEKPEFVCYSYEDPQWVTVLDEKFGNRYSYSRSEIENGTTSAPSIVAARYFAAHPLERPWEDSKPGEVWVITYKGDEGPAIVNSDGCFETPEYVSAPLNKAITAGYRIWREGEEN